MINSQGKFSLDLLATLPTNQAVLRQHIFDFDKDISVNMLDVFQKFISVGNLINNFSPFLSSVAKKLDSLNPSSEEYQNEKETFDRMIGAIQAAFTEESSSSSAFNYLKNISKVITDYYNEKIEDDVSTFDEDLKIGTQKYDHDVSSLTSQINALQKKLNEDNEQLAGGAVSQIPQVVSFGWSIGSLFESPTSKGSMGINIAMAITDEVLKDIEFEQQYETLNNSINSTITEYKNAIDLLADEKQEIVILQTLSNQVDIFGQHIQNSSKNLISITSSMQDLNDAFEYVLSLDVPPSNDYFESLISEMNIFWRSVLNDSEKYIQAFEK